MYGPRKLLVCGFSAAEESLFPALLETMGLGDMPVCFATDQDMSRTLADILNSEPGEGGQGKSAMRRAGIMSGFKQAELHRLLNGYRESGLPAILWATLTPVAENWLLKDLLEELGAEAEAFRKRKEAERP
jgi:hypothetical protein